MKLQFMLLALILSALGTASAADWHMIPTDIKENPTGLFFIDENNGYLVSREGSIFKLGLTDTGWTYSKTFVGFSLNGIHLFAGGKKGVVFGDKGKISITEDFGRNWSTDSMISTYRFTDMVFFDTLEWVVVGTDSEKGTATKGIAFKTKDGGKNWIPLSIKGRRFYSIDKSPEGFLTVAGQNFIHISRDSGTSWQAIQIHSRGNVKTASIRGSRGIMVGKGGYLALSNDGGQNWEAKPILDEKISFYNLLMVDSRRAFIVGSLGEILYTEDSGHNWIPQPSTAIYDLLGILQAGNKIYAYGRSGTLIYTELEK